MSEDLSTVITDSPVPTDIETTFCGRSTGQVCICENCEATRLRILNRHLSNNKKKRARNEASDESTHGSASMTMPTSDPESRAAMVATRQKVAERSLKEDQSDKAPEDEYEQKVSIMAKACRTILECIGEDPSREGLLKTPERWAKALLFMCSGYSKSPDQVTNGAVFAENHDEMVVVRNIDIHSLCEHHMVPFTGHVHIGYIPNGKILGLSKLARIAELYARRLQVQERLTRQIADALVETIEPLGVAVVVECTHFCMVMRGVQKTGALTTTSAVRGCFETNSKTRAEFFSIIQRK